MKFSISITEKLARVSYNINLTTILDTMKERHLGPRDIHPGDYVFAKIDFQEDNTSSEVIIVEIDQVALNYVTVKEGSGYTKYAWSEIFPIPLTEENLRRFDFHLVSSLFDRYPIYAKGLVSIDTCANWAGDQIGSRVYFNDGDGEDVMYLHEVQQYVYRQSAGTYDFDLKTAPFAHFCYPMVRRC